jgi:hypothetical protein
MALNASCAFEEGALQGWVGALCFQQLVGRVQVTYISADSCAVSLSVVDSVEFLQENL